MARRMASARSAGLDPSDGTVPGVWRNWRRAQETFFILRYKRAGKDSRIPVVRLSAAREDTETVKIIRSKCDCRGNKLERTKEAHRKFSQLSKHRALEPSQPELLRACCEP
ncbi:uncharacterized protein LOC143693900 isoform X3 [Agelaius phoeniceus]|uniref:uncharacterized protein LOC143693900 isoform X3 n=1 Tax=Agelaius phoeniceus TaxID=39638 RepID=UPI004055328F